jgi:hypothetical protein
LPLAPVVPVPPVDPVAPLPVPDPVLPTAVPEVPIEPSGLSSPLGPTTFAFPSVPAHPATATKETKTEEAIEASVRFVLGVMRGIDRKGYPKRVPPESHSIVFTESPLFFWQLARSHM